MFKKLLIPPPPLLLRRPLEELRKERLLVLGIMAIRCVKESSRVKSSIDLTNLTGF
jgi:hypothetical protein